MGITSRYLMILLVIIGLALALVALPAAAPEPAPVTTVAIDTPPPEAIETPQERAFEQRLEEIGAGLPGTVGIAVVDVETGRDYDFNGDDLLPQQSVSKLWVAMTALSQVDQGKLDLAERVQIRREDLTLFYQPIREIVRTRGAYSSDYYDLMRRALAQSDNSANDRLLRRVGGADAVQDWLDKSGLAAIRFGKDERTKQSEIAGVTWRQTYSYRNEFYEARDRVPAARRKAAFENYLADPVDGASALSIARAMALLAQGKLLSDGSTSYLRNILEQTRSGPRRLKGGVPDGWRIEHKTGTGQVFDGEQSGYNDVGLLIAPDGSEYAVAVMIGRTRASFAARMDMMQDVSRAIVEFHGSRSGAGDTAT